MPKLAKLALEDGTVYTGRAFGAIGERTGEVVFNTSMTGYQEVLTDPSYRGQIVTMTYPLIGNYGIAREDNESQQPQVEGFVVREAVAVPSNYRAQQSLGDYLAEHGIPGIERIDTRALVRRLRVRGAMMGVLSSVDLDDESLVHKARTAPSIVGRDLVREVVPTGTRSWNEGFVSPLVSYLPTCPVTHHVVALDFGMKWNIARCLVQVGCKLTILPGTASASDVLAHQPDGIFLSNGPGDPEPLGYAIETIRQLVGKRPIFGICLGHQLIGLALGGQDVQAEVRPPRRKPAGSQPADWPGRDHHAEPRFRGRCADAAPLSGANAPQPQRSDARRHAAYASPLVRRAVSPRSLGRPARLQLSVRAIPPIDGLAGAGRSQGGDGQPGPRLG
jgi:carbamoyl-phosphate synthase small subunit